MRQLFGLFIAFIVFTSCTPPMHVASSYGSAQQNQSGTIDKSLFNDKDRTISEENIQKLLDGNILIGDSLKIALFNYSFYSKGSYYFKRYSPWNDEEFLKTQQEYINTLTSEINSTETVDKVILMPSMMANEASTITNLRETAVRLQADFLLVYSIKSDIYYKYKMLKADETKAFATIEAFLMDSRTGVIPFTTIITKESYRKKTSNEITTEELRKKVEKEVVIMALKEVGQEIKAFFSKN